MLDDSLHNKEMATENIKLFCFLKLKTTAHAA